MTDREALRRLVEDIIERVKSKQGEWWYPRSDSGRDLADTMVTWFTGDDFDEEAWTVWVMRIRAAEDEAAALATPAAPELDEERLNHSQLRMILESELLGRRFANGVSTDVIDSILRAAAARKPE